MPTRQITPMAEIDRQIDEYTERQKRVLVRNLTAVGEQAVNKARSLKGPDLHIFWDTQKGQPLRNIPPHTPGYIDRTANLRSSIGYIVAVDGRVVEMSDFTPIQGRTGNGAEGAETGKEYARRLASQHPKEIILIVVAGMNYAVYVQKRGYDVTFSAEALANQLLHQLGMPNTIRISQ